MKQNNKKTRKKVKIKEEKQLIVEVLVVYLVQH